MELSAGGDLDDIRRQVLAASFLPVGNVPLYQAFQETIRKYKNPGKLDPEYLFDLIERQLEDGLSFMAIHWGINQYSVQHLRTQGFRYGGLCSKGGTFMVTCAGDHGVVEEGVSLFPQEVTPQMVDNFVNQGASINVLARHAGARFRGSRSQIYAPTPGA